MAGETDNEGEQTISIKEYLNDVEEKELEADLVLGGDEGKECTYSKGYMKRQAIFSCLTCTSEGNAGVCTACSLSCHDGHEIVELWTKRNFRCDCGNSKFGEFFCKLFPSKDVENVQNSYNHNFKGVYCTCDRPYPDPDVEEQVEMIQCCMCEDWFHEEHLGLESSEEIPRDEEGVPQYEDFMCKACSAVCSFLTLYPQTIWAAGVQCNAAANTNKDKDVLEDISSACGSGKLENATSSHSSPTKDCVTADANSGSLSDGKEHIIGESSDTNIEKMEILNGIADMKDEFINFLFSCSQVETIETCVDCVHFIAYMKIVYIYFGEMRMEEEEQIQGEERRKVLGKRKLNLGDLLWRVFCLAILSSINLVFIEVDKLNKSANFQVEINSAQTINTATAQPKLKYV
ncbi:hypothetical protein JRO89_XS13G0140600 [Xanthoceras sorbifolium]|uniref:UBR-type domain-containing protein n=1 Tax=Xanthoceras sorbifolium TaxID=99658 RepID=A0ABQ8H8A0_9ROSI|nr:hypothetical protein JRO89_XS13G0140600 [Xanthoceras sorbifolium]